MIKQIVATSTASMSNGEKIAVRKCSEPEDDLLQIFNISLEPSLNCRNCPF